MSDTTTNTNEQTNVATQQPNIASVATVNVEDLLAKVRAEEKGKLYPEIEKLKAEVNTKIERINSLLLSVAEKEEKIIAITKDNETLKNEIENVKVEGEKSKVDTKELKELKEQISKLEKDLQDKEALIASIEADKLAMQTKAENEAYRAEKIKDLDDSVHDLVFGNSKEEIDNTYTKAKSAYEKLTNRLGKPNQPSIPRPGVSPHATMDEFKNLTPEQIRAIGADPKKWKEFREKYGLK
jgi:DNA repair exonuclease SbcCD ATPase subunit